ncbi:MAG TPA: hypothetical protein VLL08_08265 [Kineosporiaceae bacterium]|nr:hypothetical protein [Kineosporiaceae bacterium]
MGQAALIGSVGLLAVTACSADGSARPAAVSTSPPASVLEPSWSQPGTVLLSYTADDRTNSSAAPRITQWVTQLTVGSDGGIEALQSTGSLVGKVVDTASWKTGGQMRASHAPDCKPVDDGPGPTGDVETVLAESFGPLSQRSSVGWTRNGAVLTRPGPYPDSEFRVQMVPLAKRSFILWNTAENREIFTLRNIDIKHRSGSEDLAAPECGGPAPAAPS